MVMTRREQQRKAATMRTLGCVGVCLLAGRLLVACLVSPDPKLWMSRTDGQSSREAGGDATTDTGRVETLHADALSCTPAGLPTTCDPIAPSGCSSGSCYLLAKEGLSCVCPAGTTSEGGSCGATKECAPGYLCAGWTAPGICRQVCNPDAPKCPSGKQCTSLTNHPGFGYCGPPGADAGGT